MYWLTNLGITGGATVGIQLAFFAVAATLKFDKITDFAGSINFLFIGWLCYCLQQTYFVRQSVATALLSLWAIRLGLFLLTRVLIREKDSRFDEMREKPLRFLVFWIIQMIWVWTVSLPVTILNSTTVDTPLNEYDYVGWSLWGVGFLIEAIADQQKFNQVQARRAAKAAGQPLPDFVAPGGLWSYSRHPNYFGEIIMWLGLYLSTCSVYEANQLSPVGFIVGALSPVLTFVLLMFISGIPLAEARSDKRYKDSNGYVQYKTSTSPLIPIPPSLYSALPVPVRQIFLFEFPLYWKRFHHDNNRVSQQPDTSNLISNISKPNYDAVIDVHPGSDTASLPSSSSDEKPAAQA